MATKSNNTIGNPYHDENGQFTSADGQGSSGSKEVFANDKVDSNVANQTKLKAGADLGDIVKALNGQTPVVQTPTTVSSVIDTTTPLTMPTSIQDAEFQGNRILGATNVVGYADNTDLQVAHEFNKGLRAVCADFPKLFSGEQLFLYGTTDRRDYGSDKKTIRQDEQKLIKSVLSNPVYQDKLKNVNMTLDGIMDIMTLSLHVAKKTFQSVPEKGCGGFTKMADYNDKKHLINAYNVIKFNEHYSKDIQKWNNYPLLAIKQGHFLPVGDKNGAFMVAVHELGHHCFEKLVDLMDSNEQAQLKQIVSPKDILKLQNNKEISGYATTSRHEHIAECFANVYCMGDQATQHNKKLFKFLKGVYARIFG